MLLIMTGCGVRETATSQVPTTSVEEGYEMPTNVTVPSTVTSQAITPTPDVYLRYGDANSILILREELTRTDLSDEDRAFYEAKLGQAEFEASKKATAQVGPTAVRRGRPAAVQDVHATPTSTTTPGISDTAFNGIKGIQIANGWIGPVDGVWFNIHAGSLEDDRSQGLLYFRAANVMEAPIETYLTPTKAGIVKVIAEQNEQLTLEAEDGTLFVFDIPSREFVDSTLAVTPTPTFDIYREYGQWEEITHFREELQRTDLSEEDREFYERNLAAVEYSAEVRATAKAGPTAVRRGRPADVQDARPTSTPGISDTAFNGIKGIRIANVWRGPVDGIWFNIHAASLEDDRSQGLLYFRAVDVMEAPLEIYWTPTKNGIVKVIAEENEQLTLEAEDGTLFVFDLPSRTYVDSTLAVTPTPTLDIYREYGQWEEITHFREELQRTDLSDDTRHRLETNLAQAEFEAEHRATAQVGPTAVRRGRPAEVQDVHATPTATSTPGISDTAFNGIKGIRIANVWNGPVDGIWTKIHAGSLEDDRSQGLLYFRAANVMEAPLEIYQTPTKNGIVKIIAKENEQLTLEAEDGTLFVFDIPSRTYVDSSLAVTPTPTVVPE